MEKRCREDSCVRVFGCGVVFDGTGTARLRRAGRSTLRGRCRERQRNWSRGFFFFGPPIATAAALRRSSRRQRDESRKNAHAALRRPPSLRVHIKWPADTPSISVAPPPRVGENSKFNDSVLAQFSDAVDPHGRPRSIQRDGQSDWS